MPITFPGEILVTGASGFIGRALVCHLCSLGYSVAALSRKIDKAFPVGVRSIRGDLLAPSSLPPDLFSGVKAVFQCAGEINDPSNMRRLHVDGTARLLDLACREAVGNSSRSIRWVPLRQNSCRPDMILNLGAIGMKDGTVRRSIQEQGGGAVVAA